MTAKIIQIKNSKLTFNLIIAGILFSAVFYIYCVNSAVRNVVLREQTESQITDLSNKVSELEYKYVSYESELTIDKAKAIGLNEPALKVFISKNSTSKPLSLNNR